MTDFYLSLLSLLSQFEFSSFFTIYVFVLHLTRVTVVRRRGGGGGQDGKWSHFPPGFFNPSPSYTAQYFHSKQLKYSVEKIFSLKFGQVGCKRPKSYFQINIMTCLFMPASPNLLVHLSYF